MTTADAGSERDKPLCGGKRRGGGTCHRPAGWGTDHVGVGRCKLHGGSTQSHRKAAAGKMADLELRRLGRPLVGADPQQQLLAMVCEAAGNVATLRQMVSELTMPGDGPETVDEALYGPRGHLYGLMFHPSGMPTGEAREHVLVVMYREWADRLVSYSASAIKCGIAERQVVVAEQQAALVAKVIMGLLDDPELELTREQRDRGRRLAGRHMRALNPVIAA